LEAEETSSNSIRLEPILGGSDEAVEGVLIRADVLGIGDWLLSSEPISSSSDEGVEGVWIGGKVLFTGDWFMAISSVAWFILIQSKKYKDKISH